MRTEWPRMALGAGVIILGLVLLLSTTGFIEFGSALEWLWPLGLILAGLAFMARQWSVGSLFIVLAVIAGGFATTFPYDGVPGELQAFAVEAPLENASRVGLDLSFVGGELLLTTIPSDSLSLLATDYWEPEAQVHSDGGEAVMVVERGIQEPRFGKGAVWNVSVPHNASATLALEMVATDAEIDLRAAELDRLVVSNVASDMDIRLPASNSTVSVDSVASDVSISYPARVGVRLEYSAVAADVSPAGEFPLPADGWYVLNEARRR